MSDKDIVDRLKAEGQLLRNTGVNSVKTMIDRFDKFSEVMSEVNVQLMEQTAILRSLLNSHESVLKIEEERRKINDLKVDQQPSNPKPELLPNGKPPPISPNGNDNPISELLAGASGGLAAMMSGWFLKRVGAGAVIAFIAPVLGDWLGKFTEDLLVSAEFKESFASSIGEAIGATSMTYLVLRAFGKRFAAFAATGAFAASFADEIVDAMGLDGEMVMTNLFGNDVSLDNMVGGILGALSIGITAYLTSQSFRKMAGAAITAAIANTPKMGLFKAGIAGSVITAYLMYGDEAKKAIENMGVPEGLANIAVDVPALALTGATLGSFFGPAGTIVGAAIGFALAAGNSILGWLNDRAEKLKTEARQELDKKTNEEIMDAYRKGDFSSLLPSEISNNMNERDKRDLFQERINQMSPSEISPNIVYEDKGSTYLSRQSLDDLGQKIFNDENMTQQEMNKVYSDAIEARSKIENLFKKETQGLIKPDTKEYQDLNTIRSQGIYEDLNELISILETKGAKKINSNSNQTIIPSAEENKNVTPSKMETPEISPKPQQDRFSELSRVSETASMMQVIPMAFNPVNNVNTGGNSHSTTIINNVGPMNDLDKPLYA